MTQKTRTSCTYWSPLYPGKSVLKSKGRSIWVGNIWKYLTWLKLQECKWFSWFLNTQKICISNSSVFQKLLLKKDIISFQIKARHSHIVPEWLCQPEIAFFQINTPLFIIFQTSTPIITLILHCSSTMVKGHKKKLIPRHHLHLHNHQHQRCLQIGA